MSIEWSDFALDSLAEIILWYEQQAGHAVAKSVEDRIFKQVQTVATFPRSIPVSEFMPALRKLVIKNLPYNAYTRQRADGVWEVVDIVHTSRKLPKTEK